MSCTVQGKPRTAGHVTHGTLEPFVLVTDTLVVHTLAIESALEVTAFARVARITDAP